MWIPVARLHLHKEGCSAVPEVRLACPSHACSPLLTPAQVRDALLRAVPDARALALEHARTHFSPEASKRIMMQQAQELLASLDLLAELAGGGPAAAEAAAATAAGGAGAGGAAGGAGGRSGPGPVQVSCWRKVRGSWRSQELGLCGGGVA